MSNCLGIYVEDNLIKYAKVSRNNDLIKVESFGMKFYDKLDETIKQIVEETYSYKIPVSVNLAEGKYHYFDVFGSLSKKDIDGIIKTNFENVCFDDGINKDSFEQRYVLAPSPESREKVRAIHIAAPKTSVARRKNQFSDYKLSSVAPTSVAVANLVKQKTNDKQSCLIVNIEEKTTITKMAENNITDVKVIDYGSTEILDKISSKENSYAKAYEICKNTTIYTSEGKDLQYEENQYLEDIMPTLYNIVTEVRKITSESLDPIEKVYITGTLSVINNIDIYFQEYLKSTKCEILRPYFINNNSKINIKDYIEVNSAIALALQMLDVKGNTVNFLRENASRRMAAILQSDVSIPKLNEIDLSDVYQKHGGAINIVTSTGLLILIVYIVWMIILNGLLTAKSIAAKKAEDDVNYKTQTVNSYNDKLNNRVEEYKTLIADIERNNDRISENKRYKNTIPNLMNNLMAIIPKEVKLVSVENPNTTHIVIKANAPRYEQLAFFKTKLKTEGVLKDVVSDTGVATNENSITVTIEGELPWKKK